VRFVAWNCHGGLKRKLQLLTELGTDVAVLSEVAQIAPATSLLQPSIGWAWAGKLTSRGLAIATLTGDLQTVAPREHSGSFSVAGLLSSGTGVLGIWTCPPNKGDPYGPEALAAIDAYGDWLRDVPVIVAGDFNLQPNGLEDAKTGVLKRVFAQLHALGYASVYHHHFKEKFGEETHPTHYWTFKETAPFHIDYCFAPESLLAQVRNVEVGTYAQWVAKRGDLAGYSDHVPMIIDFDL
jgi:hypothetical protein